MNRMQMLIAIIEATWHMALTAAPWLVIGLIVAGLIKVYVPSAWLTEFLKGRGGVVKAAFIGAPLPLCSCGVIPAALALRRQGASRGSVMSFLVATPETGVDSVAVSYALLGPFLAIVRPISAITSAIITGLLGVAVRPATQRTNTQAAAETSGTCCSSRPEPKTTCGCSTPKPEPQLQAKPSCCASKASEPEPKASCCSSKQTASDDTGTPSSSKQGLFAAMIDAAGQILGDTAKWLLIGLVLAGVISAFIEPGQFAELGSGIGVMVLMVFVGIPMYICAVASTPLAASLLIAGLSPGAVLVFMLAGPATNIATLGVVRQELGTRYMVAYLFGVGLSAILCGLATDWVAGAMGIAASAQAQHAHEHEMIPQWLAITCLVMLVLLAIKPLRARLVPPEPQPA